MLFRFLKLFLLNSLLNLLIRFKKLEYSRDLSQFRMAVTVARRVPVVGGVVGMGADGYATWRIGRYAERELKMRVFPPPQPLTEPTRALLQVGDSEASRRG